MQVNIKFESINDFNNNLDFISKNWHYLNNSNNNYFIETFVFNYIYKELENIINNIKFKNYLRIITPFYKLSAEQLKFKDVSVLKDLSNLICDNYILFNFDSVHYDTRETKQKLNKIFIIRELLYIISDYESQRDAKFNLYNV